jgi:hypothetical protein
MVVLVIRVAMVGACPPPPETTYELACVHGDTYVVEASDGGCTVADADGTRHPVSAIGECLDGLVLETTSRTTFMFVSDHGAVADLPPASQLTWQGCPILSSSAIGHIIRAIQLAIPIASSLSAQGWKVKVRQHERLEEPHVSVMRKTSTWRWGLRSQDFLDVVPDPRDVPANLVGWLARHCGALSALWDAVYPENPV